MYTKLKKTERKECEEINWKKTWVMELTFKNWDNKLRVLIKDLVDWDDKHIIKEAKQKAREYFKNLKKSDK